MAKKEYSLVQLVISLTLIAVVAAVALAGAYTLTKEPIEKAQVKKQEEAIAKVLPGFSGEIKEVKILPIDGKDSVLLHLAYQNGEFMGAAVETYTDIAFNGRFSIMVSFDTEGMILETEVLQMSETPGLGDKINKSKDENFSSQYNGLNPGIANLKVKKDGGEIDAITAATISSRAFSDAVERAYQAFLMAKEVNDE